MNLKSVKKPRSKPTDQAVQSLRKPPQSIEAEQAVLGGIMLENSRWDSVVERLREEDFYLYAHRLIFKAMALLSETQQPIDVITVHDQLQQRKELEAVGGFAYLTDLVRITPSAANLLHYAEIVRDRAILRSLLNASTLISEMAYQTEGRSAREILESAESQIFTIAEKQAASGGPLPIKDLLGHTLSRIEERYDQTEHGGLTGVSSGFVDLDKKTAGLQAADLIVLAARPAMGKTTLAMNICLNVALTESKPVLVFTLEMSAEQIIFRLLSALSQVNQTALRSGELHDADWSRIMSSVELLLTRNNFYLDDSSALTPAEVSARARRLYREHGGLSLIMIDYLQLMRGSARSENRNLEIGEISRALKALAKELHVPVLVLSQLNRSLEQRSEKRPLNSDLRESGSIEQDADLILFIYRDEVYRQGKLHTEGAGPVPGEAELIIGKQRNGPTGTIKLTFRGECARFDNYAPNVSIAPFRE